MRGQTVVPGLGRAVHGQRQSLGAARQVARDHERGPELAHGAGEGEHGPGQDAASGQRQTDAQEDAPFRISEGPGRVFVFAFHTVQGGAGGFEDEREGDHGSGDHRPLPGEDQGDAEGFLQPAARKTVPPEQHDQIITQHRRRQHHGQAQDGIEQFLSGEAVAVENPAQEHPEDQGGQGGQGGHAQAELHREEKGRVHSHCPLARVGRCSTVGG